MDPNLCTDCGHEIDSHSMRDDYGEPCDVSCEDCFATEPVAYAFCQPCREGRHAECEAEAGDCTNTCHPRRQYVVAFDNHDGFREDRDVDTVVASSAEEAIAIVRRLPYVKADARVWVV